jgi:hypothetical protein
MNVLNQPVLCLNCLWQPVGEKTVKEALIAMLGGEGGKRPPALAIDQDFAVDADGNVNWNEMIYANPVDWDTWITLPIREYDIEIHSCSMTIRCPRVLVQPNFAKMPTVTPRPTKDAIRKRDGGRCQYTGEALSWAESNIDHVIPRAQGGKNTFENMVLSSKAINTKKADKRPEQVGLKLLRKPVAPKPMPLMSTFTVAQHPCWLPFLPAVKEVRAIRT